MEERTSIPKKELKIELWNVRTLHQVGRLAGVERIFEDGGYNLMGLCKNRWNASDETHGKGDALIVTGRWRRKLME